MTSSMDHAPAPLLDHISHWSEPAQQALWRCRTLFHLIAEENGLGDLDEALKWGQPAWRPKRPRTGSTLRMGWSEVTPDQLALYVDCKTPTCRATTDGAPWPSRSPRRFPNKPWRIWRK